MKLNTTKNDLKTNADFTSKEFGIGDASVVIEILRNRLYAHPIRTLVQEYISNGRDAIRESGRKAKLMVQSPTTFEPTFKVRDYGVGISPDRISDVFVMYGASTKRSSNNQTGGFGIGAKSAWSYTDSFTVTTFVDGTQRNYIAHVGANSNGRLDLLETKPTTEANGTEIQIAVKHQDVHAFRDAIRRTIYFWPQADKPEVLGMGAEDFIVGPDSTPIKIGDTEISKNLPNYIDRNQDGLKVVVDGIVYPIDDDFVDANKDLKKFVQLFSYRAHLVVKIPNGVVEVSASREKLADSQRTRDALNAMAVKWTKEVQKYFAAEFDKAKTVFEFANTYNNFNDVFNQESMPKNFGAFNAGNQAITSDSFKKLTLIGVSDWNKKVLRKQTELIKIAQFNHIFIDDIEESAVMRNRRYRELLLKSLTFMVIKNEGNTHVEIKDATGKVTGHTQVKSKLMKQKEFDALMLDLNATKLSSVVVPEPTKEEKAKKVRERGTIPAHMASYSRDIRDIDLTTNTKKFYYAPLELNSETLRDLKDFVLTHAKRELCRLSKDSIAKIEGDANFEPIKTFLDSYTPTKTHVAAVLQEIAKNTQTVTQLNHIRNKIKVKPILEMLETYDGLKTSEVPSALKDIILKSDEIKEFKQADGEFKALIDSKYPLVPHVDMRYTNSTKVKEEMAWYINNK